MNLARKRVGILLVCSILFVISVQPQTKSTGPPPTPEEAKKYLENAEQDLFDLSIKASRTAWVQENFITVDTQSLAAEANEAANTAATKYAKQAHRFDHVQLSPELARKRLLLELATSFPAPDDPDRGGFSWVIVAKP